MGRAVGGNEGHLFIMRIPISLSKRGQECLIFSCDAALEHQTYVCLLVPLCLPVSKVEMTQDKVP